MNVWRALTKRRGDHRWDLSLRALGSAGLVGIPLTLLFPGAVPLVWLGVVGVPANGPLSPILPTLFDPLIIEAGKHAPAISVTLVALGVYMYMEFVNWYIYAWALSWERMDAVRHNRVVRWGVERFGRAPLTTIVFFAVTPLPFWAVRCLAILRGYPIRRFMAATAVGRFPRFFVYAWLGSTLSIPTGALVAVIVGGALVAIGSRVVKHQPILADTILDMAPQQTQNEPPPRFGSEASLHARETASPSSRSGGAGGGLEHGPLPGK